MSRLGEVIKQARLKKGMTAKELAKKCGVAEAFILDAESGKKIIQESLANKISDILELKVNEVNYDDTDDINEFKRKEQEIKKSEPQQQTAQIVDRWEDAFSTVIKKIPVYSMDGVRVIDYKSIPAGEKKIEGYNSDKIFYIKLEDDYLTGFRLKKGDLIMVASVGQVTKDALNYIEYKGAKMIRHVKRLDGRNLLLISHSSEIKTTTVDEKEIKALGVCIKAEIYL